MRLVKSEGLVKFFQKHFKNVYKMEDIFVFNKLKAHKNCVL